MMLRKLPLQLKKRGEKLTLTTIVEAVLVAGALIVLIFLGIGLYNLFFHNADEQNAKQTFQSLITRVETISDNNPIKHNMILPEDYAIMDTAQTGDCFSQQTQFNDLPEQCKTADCLCLCKSKIVGVCDEVVECKLVENKQSGKNIQYSSKIDPKLETNKLIIDQIKSGGSKQFIDDKKVYSCLYIPGFAKKPNSFGITKSGNQILFCQNQCNPNSPDCCQTENFKKINQEKFDKLKKAFEECKADTIAATNPLTYMQAVKQGTFVDQTIDFLPYIAEQTQTSLYQFTFDKTGNLDQTAGAANQKIPLEKKPFESLSGDGTTIILCSDVTNPVKSPDHKKEFIGSDNKKRTIELGSCNLVQETESIKSAKGYYLRIIKQAQASNIVEYTTTSLTKEEFDAIYDNKIYLQLFNDNLYILPASYLDKSNKLDFYDVKTAEKAYTYGKSKQINIDTNQAEEIDLHSAKLPINAHIIDISNNKLKQFFPQNPDTELIQNCDDLTSANTKHGNYYYIQEPETDTTEGNAYRVIIDYGTCTTQLKHNSETTGCVPSAGNDCSAGSPPQSETEQIANGVQKRYIRIVKDDPSGLTILYTDDTLTAADDFINKLLYFHNNKLFIIDTISSLDLNSLYKIDLLKNEKKKITIALDPQTIDIQKLPKPKQCKKNEQLYPFGDYTKLVINTAGKATLVVNSQPAMEFSFSDLLYAGNNLFCITNNPENPSDITTGQEITFEPNSFLNFGDTGIDRICLSVRK